mmetsp:Transcript_2486/g.6706  ORF Transcript_2486/g.6706 Transcript_2486/m.6706 type:complete len:400 (-) Transcript_2486:657-1856(-)
MAVALLETISQQDRFVDCFSRMLCPPQSMRQERTVLAYKRITENENYRAMLRSDSRASRPEPFGRSVTGIGKCARVPHRHRIPVVPPWWIGRRRTPRGSSDSVFDAGARRARSVPFRFEESPASRAEKTDGMPGKDDPPLRRRRRRRRLLRWFQPRSFTACACACVCVGDVFRTTDGSVVGARRFRPPARPRRRRRERNPVEGVSFSRGRPRERRSGEARERTPRGRVGSRSIESIRERASDRPTRRFRFVSLGCVFVVAFPALARLLAARKEAHRTKASRSRFAPDSIRFDSIGSPARTRERENDTRTSFGRWVLLLFPFFASRRWSVVGVLRVVVVVRSVARSEISSSSFFGVETSDDDAFPTRFFFFFAVVESSSSRGHVVVEAVVVVVATPPRRR